MIFISVGNNEDNFFRLFKKFENIINKNSIIRTKIICQTGYTNYKNRNFKLINFLEKRKFLNFLKKSDFFISHAGAGSILDSLSCNHLRTKWCKRFPCQNHLLIHHHLSLLQEILLSC